MLLIFLLQANSVLANKRENIIKNTIQNYLHLKNEAKVTGDTNNLETVLKKFTNNIDILNNSISGAEREYNAIHKNNGGYIKADTTVRFISKPQELKNGNVSVLVEENSVLYLSAEGGPSFTQELIEHLITLSPKNEEGWEIISDLIQNGFKSQLPIDASEEIPLLDPTLDHPIDTTIEPTILELNNMRPIDSSSTKESLSPSSLSQSYTGQYYYPSYSAYYARKWAVSPNPDYRYFVDNDCTNFISQALKYGGWPDYPGYYTSWYAWWYTWPVQGRAWINAHAFYVFTRDVNRGYIARSFAEMQVGDILQIDWDRDGHIDHSGIVTSKDVVGTIYVSYHSNNTLDKDINVLVAAFPNANWYGWRMWNWN